MSTVGDSAQHREQQEIDQYFSRRPREKWRLGRGVYLCVVIGLVFATGIVSAVAEDSGATGAPVVLVLAAWIFMGFVAAARARDATRNVVGWVLLAMFVPFCWIVLGCFRTVDVQSDELRNTFA
jgi:hypothetical protein